MSLAESSPGGKKESRVEIDKRQSREHEERARVALKEGRVSEYIRLLDQAADFEYYAFCSTDRNDVRSRNESAFRTISLSYENQSDRIVIDRVPLVLGSLGSGINPETREQIEEMAKKSQARLSE